MHLSAAAYVVEQNATEQLLCALAYSQMNSDATKGRANRAKKTNIIVFIFFSFDAFFSSLLTQSSFLQVNFCSLTGMGVLQILQCMWGVTLNESLPLLV